MSLDDKYMRTLGLIGEWHNYFDNKVYVSCSGGKDSTVLADIDAKWCMVTGQPLTLVFSNTGLEYPEIQRHVRELKPYFEKKYGIEVNLKVVYPKMRFDEVIRTYGYPLIGKEVAEAIYYARRIRHSADVERERETASGENYLAEEARVAGNPNLIETSGAANRRTILQGRWGGTLQTEWKRRLFEGKVKNKGTRAEQRRAGVVPQQRGMTTFRANADGMNCEDSSPVLNGQTGEGGVFSNAEEQFGTKSMFNKEKWLPLARDVPFMISHYCCNVMKKRPLTKFQKDMGMKPMLGSMAEESRLRQQAWIRHGCNAFEGSKQTSQPMSFWTEQDVLAFTLREDLPLASVYGDIVAVDDGGNEYDPALVLGDCKLKCTGCDRTGCIFCGFGAHLEKPGEGRFERLAFTHPKQYEYCIGGGMWADNPAYDPTAPKMDGEWQNWNPKKIWVPSKQGLGMGKVFDMVNEIYGKDFIKYD